MTDYTDQRFSTRLGLLLSVLGIAVGTIRAQDRISVVTTLPDLKSIAEEVGGDRFVIELAALLRDFAGVKHGDRVTIAGQSVLYLTGTIEV